MRTLLLRARPLLLVGSTGLARALRRVLRTEHAGRAFRPTGPAPLPGDGILVVAGSAHPATRGGLVLVGGETAYHVLEGPGLRAPWLESRLCPLVVRARLMAGAWAGLAVVTKGGSSGAPDLLASIVRQLARGAG